MPPRERHPYPQLTGGSLAHPHRSGRGLERVKNPFALCPDTWGKLGEPLPLLEINLCFPHRRQQSHLCCGGELGDIPQRVLSVDMWCLKAGQSGETRGFANKKAELLVVIPGHSHYLCYKKV